MPEPFRLSKIGVIMLGVSDIEKSVPFYRDKLGLKLSARFDEFAFFDAGSVTLALSGGLARATGKGAGAVEIVFSVEHIRPAFLALSMAGVQFTREPRIVSGSNLAANFRDPDGHILSIFGPQ